MIKIEKRKIIQLATAILYNCNFAGFKDANIYTGEIKKLCVPGLNCYSCPLAIASCPLGSLQNYIAQKSGLKGMAIRFPYYVLGLIILFGVIFGRVVCGFLCPFGFFQEILYKIKTSKVMKNEFTRKLTILKYFILLVFVIIIPVIINGPSFCKYICPAGTLEAGIIHVATKEQLKSIIGVLYYFKVFIAAFMIIMSVILYRFFCKFICPLGAIYSFFNKVSVLGLKIDSSKCTHCNACTKTCLMDVKEVGDRECIECGACIKRCPEKAIYRIKPTL